MPVNTDYEEMLRRMNVNAMQTCHSYDDFIRKVYQRENQEIPVTFAILVADYHQQNAREYIINYVSRFDRLSEKYINFYLPGYEFSIPEKADIGISGSYYRFDRMEYIDFLEHFCGDFDMDFPYTPVLALIEYDRGAVQSSRKVIIELEANGSDIKQSGRLIETIINIAKEHVSLDAFSHELVRRKMVGSLLDRIVESIDNALLASVVSGFQNTRRYCIK